MCNMEIVKSLKITQGQSEAVNQIRTDNAMDKRQQQQHAKRQTNAQKTRLNN